MASVDVIVPCYQYGHFLRDCAASVLTQDVSDVRLVIIDNASTDNTLEVARELAAADRRVEVIAHRSNLGHLASFNEGIDRASASYFLILCADDLLAPGALAHAVSIMDQHPEVVLTYGAALVIGGENTVLPPGEEAENAQWQILRGNALLERFCRNARCEIPGSTVVVRTSAQKRVGYYRTELPHSCDFEMWMRFACVGSVAETKAVQAFARRHSANLSSSITHLAWYSHFDAALESFFAREGASASEAAGLHRIARRTLGEHAYWSAVANLVRGQYQLSLALFKFAFMHSPATAVLPPVTSLFRRDDAFGRITRAISDAGRRRLMIPIKEAGDAR
jgi:glycosyltransferase involved in cell wall biosynthesis